MDGNALKGSIGLKRPRYRKIYRPLIDSISIKGDATRKGSYSTFGPFYQTFMYAFIIGFRLKKRVPIEKDEEDDEFFPIGDWKPASMRDFVIMLLLNESEEWGFNWIDLEEANEEVVNAFVTELVRRMEGYANAGFEYLQEKFDKENFEFQDPFVYVNLLQQLPDSKD